jgi:hypothetical protein
MMGFKSFEADQSTLAGIELMHMLRKGRLEGNEFEGLNATEQWDRLTNPDLRFTLFTDRLQSYNADNRLLLRDLYKFTTHEMFWKSVNLSTR